MLDVGDPCRLEGDPDRNVADDRKAAPLRCSGDRVERRRREAVVDLHAARTGAGDLLHRGRGLAGVAHDARARPHGRVAVEDRPAGEDACPGELTRSDLLAEPDDVAAEVARVADRRHAVRQVEQVKELAIPHAVGRRVVHVHVDQTGKHVGVAEGGGAVALTGRGVRLDAVDRATGDDDRLVLAPPQPGVHDGDVAERDSTGRHRHRRRACREPEHGDDCDDDQDESAEGKPESAQPSASATRRSIRHRGPLREDHVVVNDDFDEPSRQAGRERGHAGHRRRGPLSEPAALTPVLPA
jgi:hypothetical protein